MSSEKPVDAGAPAPAAPTAMDPKRPSDEGHIDHVNTIATTDDIDEKKPIEDVEERDYTGVARKTDPEEIKLVRKLDWRIMVSNGTLDSC